MNAFEIFCALQILEMYTAKHDFLGEEYDQIPNNTCFEKQYDQIITSNVYFFTNNTIFV